MDKLFKQFVENKNLTNFRPLIFPGISLLIAIALIFLVIIPQINSIIKTNESIKQADAKNAALSDKVQKLKQVDIPTYEDHVKTALQALPADDDMASAITQLLFLINKNSLKIEALGIAPGNELESTGPTKLFVIKADVVGELTSLRNLVNELDQTPRLMKLASLDLVGNTRTTTLQISLAVNSFFQEVPAALGDIEAPINLPSEKDFGVLSNVKNYASFFPPTSGEQIDLPTGKTDPFQ